MQDIHPIGARGGGRLFGGGDRRIRPHLHQNPSLKCPRCDSLNTKFCYYNNYNLSQPRHFCKNCRRYWTKGGILRNVPVGGGCRKSKRARPKPSPSSPPDASAPENRGCSSRSSSESSSLTAAAATATRTRPRPRPPTSTPQPAATDASSASTLLSGFPDSALFLPRAASLSNPNHHDPSFDIEQSSSMMFAGIGSFTSLMTDPAVLSYNVSPSLSSPPFRFQCRQTQEEEQVVRGQQKLQQQHQLHQWQLQNKVSLAVGEDVTAATATGILNQTATQVEAQGMPSMTAANTGLFSAVDWPSGGEQGLFDLPGGIDHGYWGQPQWTDHHDQPLFLP